MHFRYSVYWGIGWITCSLTLGFVKKIWSHCYDWVGRRLFLVINISKRNCVHLLDLCEMNSKHCVGILVGQDVLSHAWNRVDAELQQLKLISTQIHNQIVPPSVPATMTSHARRQSAANRRRVLAHHQANATLQPSPAISDSDGSIVAASVAVTQSLTLPKLSPLGSSEFQVSQTSTTSPGISTAVVSAPTSPYGQQNEGVLMAVSNLLLCTQT